jgi:hypothetical protein
MDENILPESAFEWNLGTRHSANGRCKVTITRTEATFLSLAGDAEDFDGMANCVAIQLLSDAIIPGPCGGYLRGLDDGAIGDLAGCPIEILAGHSSSKVVGGWSGKWNLPRESAIAIDGGYTDLSANFIEECQVKGLGIRTYEGFGSVAINPDWLLSTHENMEDDLRFRYEAQEALGHIRCMERKGYLGLSSVAPDALSLLIDNAKTTANSITQDWDKTASEARQWITTVARDLLVVDSVFLKEFLNNSKVDKLISEMNENATKRDALIFYLNAFESELKVKQKNKRTAAEPTEEGFA